MLLKLIFDFIERRFFAISYFFEKRLIVLGCVLFIENHILLSDEVYTSKAKLTVLTISTEKTVSQVSTIKAEKTSKASEDIYTLIAYIRLYSEIAVKDGVSSKSYGTGIVDIFRIE